MLLGCLTAALLAYRVLIDPPMPTEIVDQKLGAYPGLLCAIGIAVGGYESVHDQRKSGRTVVRRSRSGSAIPRATRRVYCVASLKRGKEEPWTCPKSLPAS